MKIGGATGQAPSPVPVRVVHWYDKSQRLWAVYKVNATDDQIGEADYVTKSLLKATIKKIEIEISEQQLLKWFDEEYARRSRAVSDGTGKLDWLLPEYRITWSEITAKAEELGIKRNVVDMRLWWAKQRGETQ